MSVAGILGSSLFANAVTQLAQKSSSANPNTGAQSVFGSLQQRLLGSTSNSSAGGTSITGQLSQIGQDLESGNLPAAQADFTAFKISLSQHRTQTSQTSQTGSVSSGGSGSSTGASDPLAAAMLAYGSLQQGAIGGALNASILPTASTFSVNA
jgi:hypothetical protein